MGEHTQKNPNLFFEAQCMCGVAIVIFFANTQKDAEIVKWYFVIKIVFTQCENIFPSFQ